MKLCSILMMGALLLWACADKPAPEANTNKGPAAKAPATAPVQAAKIKGQAPAGHGTMPAGHGQMGAMPAGHGTMPAGHGQMGAMPAGHGAMMGHGGGDAANAGQSGSVAGRITLAAGFKEKIKPGSIIFLMARPVVPKGQRAPAIAARRIDLTPETQFPLQFVLGARDVMQGVPLKGEITLEARIDQDKDAISKSPGDLIGRLSPVKVDGAPVELLIDEAL